MKSLFLFDILITVMPSITEKKNQPVGDGKSSVAWWQPAILLSLRLSVWIVAPVLAGVFIGKWLDKKYGTEPWMFLGAVGVAFLFSMAGLVMNTMKEYKKIEKDNIKKKNNGIKSN
jgi:F0F1-type ATP synthase assembly protein I